AELFPVLGEHRPWLLRALRYAAHLSPSRRAGDRHRRVRRSVGPKAAGAGQPRRAPAMGRHAVRRAGAPGRRLLFAPGGGDLLPAPRPGDGELAGAGASPVTLRTLYPGIEPFETGFL